MTCSRCNARLPVDSPGGMCPRCALLLGLATQTSVEEPATSSQPVDDSFVIGPYRSVRLLGAGGMGAVYLAEQTVPIRRQVALKIIKPGLGSLEIVRRFETERQALALMDHPNIARVLDAGATVDGRPYFVMEYVPGIPITVYCDKHQLPARDRLRLFGDVCSAIQHAHQKGVIHRDIKPTNVLVAERDGKATVTVIDFGIAKAVDHRLAGETVFTQQGLLIGTPEYMSPEQAASSPDIDTTTDVYSLGVLLYELLTGVLPFDPQALRKRGYLEILRSIREDEPPRLVTRVRALGATATGLAERRSTTLGGLLKLLHGDLEWITMRALEKDRTRRYTSAAALAEDVARHLHDEPVLAGRPGRIYQFRKFVRRNRVLAISAAAIGAALLFGMVLTTFQYFRAERQRGLAEANAREATEQRGRAEAAARRADQSAAEARMAQTEAEKSRDRAEVERQRAESEAESNRRMLYAADMNRASQAWDEANVSLLQNLLERHRPQPGKTELRSWEWFHWWREANARLHQFDGGGPHIAFSPDGKTFGMTGPFQGFGGSKLWDWTLRRDIGQVAKSAGRAIAFSPDGKTFAVAEYNEAVSIRETASFREVAKVPFTAQGIAFSPASSVLALIAVGDPGTRTTPYGFVLKLWDLAAGKERATLPGSQRANSVAFSPDGKVLVSTHFVGGVRFWDIATAKEIPSWVNTPTRRGAKFSPDGTLLAEAGPDGITNIWEVAAKKKVVSLRAAREIEDVAFSPDGKLLATAGSDRVVQVHEVPSGRQLGDVKGFGESANSVAFSPDGSLLAIGGNEGRVKVWEVAAILAQEGIQAGRGGAGRIAYSRDSRYLVTGGGVRGLALWDAASRKAVRTFTGNKAFVNEVEVSPDGTLVASADGNSGLRVWNSATGKEVLSRDGKTVRAVGVGITLLGIGTFVSFAPAGDYLITGHDSGGASLMHILTQREVAVFGEPADKIFAAKFSPDGSQLATVGFETRKVDLWDVAKKRRRLQLKPSAFLLNYLAFSPDGRHLATFGAGYGSLNKDEYDVHIWDTATGRLTIVLKGSTQGCRCLAFSPDGRRVIACDDREVRVWDVGNGQQVSTLHSGVRVTSAAFSPDGKTLAVSDISGRVQLLEAASPEQVLAQAPAPLRKPAK